MSAPTSGSSTFAPVKLSDGSSVPGVGFGIGTAHFGNDGPELVETIKTALKVGFRHLDGAESYKVRTCSRSTRCGARFEALIKLSLSRPQNEESLGKAIAECGLPREELYGPSSLTPTHAQGRKLTLRLAVTTKCGAGLKDIPTSFDSSLQKLGLAHVDLYLIHWPQDFPKPGYPTIEQAWKQLEAIRDSGRAKAIGVSNFRVRDLEKILAMPDLKHKPACNQIEFHPFMYTAGEELYQFCASLALPLLPRARPALTLPRRPPAGKQHDIVIEAYGPTSPAFRFDGNRGDFDGVLDKVTKAVAARAGEGKVEPSQVLLRLAAQRGAVVITTSGKDWRMKEQLAAGALPELTQDEIDELVAAAKPTPQRAFMKHMDDTETEF